MISNRNHELCLCTKLDHQQGSIRDFTFNYKSNTTRNVDYLSLFFITILYIFLQIFSKTTPSHLFMERTPVYFRFQSMLQSSSVLIAHKTTNKVEVKSLTVLVMRGMAFTCTSVTGYSFHIMKERNSVLSVIPYHLIYCSS